MRAIRSIVWQNCIDEKKAVIFGSVRKADAALAGVEMELARNPHIGDSSWIVYEASTGEQLRAFKTRAEAS